MLKAKSHKQKANIRTGILVVVHIAYMSTCNTIKNLSSNICCFGCAILPYSRTMRFI